MLDGKVALVTGASRGIGKSIAQCLAKNGASLFLTARNSEKLHVLASELQEEYAVAVTALPADLREEQAIKRIFMQIKKISGKLDCLVNNAGILHDSLVGMFSSESIHETFETNVYSVLYASQYAVRLMRDSGGSIVNFSSIMGVEGEAGLSIYSASKAAVLGLTKSMAKELAPKAIRVNAVAPGFISTDMTAVLNNQQKEERIASIKMGRMGDPMEVANTVLYLVSDLSTYVTGQVIGVDGGAVV